ncbi:hypothetical protein ANN_07828 [Periplaneta americana]|uniref:Uncharacterized protein n=1 Tax=Periplaneta americana TaxID=6978 RepID=A0ABQ8T193_PERAM|nr:hypothetical protein ANN_07828 [Periplaneta americana]
MEQIFYLLHSPDLTPPDAYVWGVLKESIFRQNPPTTIVELRGKISEFFFATCNNLHLHKHTSEKGLKDYLVSNGLKLNKWKDTGLIKELTTSNGTKMLFGRCVQYSKIGINQTKVSSELQRNQPKSRKMFESETILKPNMNSITQRLRRSSANSPTERIKSAGTYRTGGTADFICTHRRKMNSSQPAREENDSKTVVISAEKYRMEVTVTNTSRPKSARVLSANKPIMHPLRRAKTIYINTAAELAVTSISAVDTKTKVSKCDSPNQISKLESSTKKIVVQKSANNTFSVNYSTRKTAAGYAEEKVKVNATKKPEEKKSCRSTLHSSGKDNRNVNVSEVKKRTLDTRKQSGKTSTSTKSHVSSAKPKGSNTTPALVDSLACVGGSRGRSTMETITERIPVTSLALEETLPTVEAEPETIILHRNLCMVSSEEIDVRLKIEESLQDVKLSDEMQCPALISMEDQLIPETPADFSIQEHREKGSSLKKEDNIVDVNLSDEKQCPVSISMKGQQIPETPEEFSIQEHQEKGSSLKKEDNIVDVKLSDEKQCPVLISMEDRQICEDPAEFSIQEHQENESSLKKEDNVVDVNLSDENQCPVSISMKDQQIPETPAEFFIQERLEKGSSLKKEDNVVDVKLSDEKQCPVLISIEDQQIPEAPAEFSIQEHQEEGSSLKKEDNVVDIRSVLIDEENKVIELPLKNGTNKANEKLLLKDEANKAGVKFPPKNEVNKTDIESSSENEANRADVEFRLKNQSSTANSTSYVKNEASRPTDEYESNIVENKSVANEINIVGVESALKNQANTVNIDFPLKNKSNIIDNTFLDNEANVAEVESSVENDIKIAHVKSFLRSEVNTVNTEFFLNNETNVINVKFPSENEDQEAYFKSYINNEANSADVESSLITGDVESSLKNETENTNSTSCDTFQQKEFTDEWLSFEINAKSSRSNPEVSSRILSNFCDRETSSDSLNLCPISSVHSSTSTASSTYLTPAGSQSTLIP